VDILHKLEKNMAALLEHIDANNQQHQAAHNKQSNKIKELEHLLSETKKTSLNQIQRLQQKNADLETALLNVQEKLTYLQNHLPKF
jgi:chromosome segregation ATPase